MDYIFLQILEQAGLLSILRFGNIEIKTLEVIGSNLFAGTVYNGIFRSTNNGENWTDVNIGLVSNDVTSFVVSGTNIYRYG